MLLFGRETDERLRNILRFEAARLIAIASDLTEIAGRENLTPSDNVFPDHAPLLERWSLGFRRVPCLVGFSTDHPILSGDHREIITSDLALLSEDLRWARTRSRWYRLGQREDSRKPN